MKTENEQFIIDNYAKLGNKKCCEILGLTKSKVSNLAFKYNLKLTKEIKNKINSESKIITDSEANVPSTNFVKKIDKHGAYILGLLWADGYLLKNNKASNNSIKLECLSEDMFYFKNSFDKTGKWHYYERQRDLKKRITCAHTTNKELRDYLVNNDYIEKSYSSPNKIISKLPKHLLKYFLLGMIDGDGCFYFNQKHGLRQFTLTGSLNQNWDSFEIMFKRLDIMYKINRKPNNKGGYSQIRILNKINIKKLGDFIYSTINEDKIGLPRKYEKYLTIIQ